MNISDYRVFVLVRILHISGVDPKIPRKMAKTHLMHARREKKKSAKKSPIFAPFRIFQRKNL